MTEPDPDSRQPERKFIFVVCRPESQQHCKNEIALARPEWVPAFSRPGFLTYKTDVAETSTSSETNTHLPSRFDLPLTFARTWGWSLESLKDASHEQLAERVLGIVAASIDVNCIHVWNRVWTDEKQRAVTRQEVEVRELVASLQKKVPKGIAINSAADADDLVIDVVRIDDGHWWIGWHVAGAIAQRWPGGVPLINSPDELISRAYFKTAEAILWSGIPVSRGDVCAEIGSAPGGSCARLIELGADVIAIDPADLDERIANHKRIKHLKMRGRDVPHREMARVSWLLVDSIVAPVQTLDTVEALTNGPQTRFRGLLLTLKLGTDDMFTELATHVARVKSWGFKFVKTRQLAYGRQEICLLALKQKSARRFRGKVRVKKEKPSSPDADTAASPPNGASQNG